MRFLSSCGDMFPFSKVPKDSDIIIWGCGNVGRQYYDQIMATKYCNIKYFVDSNWRDRLIGGAKVFNPERIRDEGAPLIVVANAQPDQQKEIIAQLRAYGIDTGRIICENNQLNLENEATRLKIFKEYYKCLKIKKIKDHSLTRVGRDNDGGYIMADTFKGGIAYSFGIASDVSWDRDMASKGYDVYMYDHTVDGLPYENEKFHFRKLGIADNYCCEQNLNTMEYFLEENGHSKTENMILKMDVEGAEWGALCMMPVSVLEQFDQIVLELHGMYYMDDMVGMRVLALQKLACTHAAIHVHYNNCARVSYVEGIPLGESWEVSLVRKKNYQLEDVDVELPIAIDMPCAASGEEIRLGHWNKYF